MFNFTHPQKFDVCTLTSTSNYVHSFWGKAIPKQYHKVALQGEGNQRDYK